jgi:GST-like protein
MGGKFGGMNRPTAGPRFEKALPIGEHPLQLYSLGTPNGHKAEAYSRPLLTSTSALSVGYTRPLFGLT